MNKSLKLLGLTCVAIGILMDGISEARGTDFWYKWRIAHKTGMHDYIKLDGNVAFLYQFNSICKTQMSTYSSLVHKFMGKQKLIWLW